MATAVPIGSQLVLALNTGLDEDMNPIIKNRSYSRVKSSASHAHVLDIGEDLGGLFDDDLEMVRRVDRAHINPA